MVRFFDNYSSMVFEAKYKTIHGEGIKLLAAKQVFQRLPIVLAQVKAGNACENLLNKIRQIIYFLYRAKEITKKVYNNIINSIKVQCKMNTILMNSGNSKTSGPHKLLLHLLDKINWKGIDKYVALSNISIYYAWKNHAITKDLKYQF